MDDILFDSHETPAHALCEQFWHGTGSCEATLVLVTVRHQSMLRVFAG
jgi:hypothetical protein